MIPTPQQLGMAKTLAFVDVPSGMTFFYKKRVAKDCFIRGRRSDR
jgi:hypothetical protein